MEYPEENERKVHLREQSAEDHRRRFTEGQIHHSIPPLALCSATRSYHRRDWRSVGAILRRCWCELLNSVRGMNEALVAELLHEEESATLDFKREQYPFVGASDDQKGELIKDVLAFANAWRRTAAYILTGVEEVKGGRSNPLGTTTHLNDNDLQQFVNTKTNRPVSFSYSAYAFDGVQIGIIEIPVQLRPVYLKKAYGKLTANTVYVRRGSSTDTAQPDEVARMGAADLGGSGAQPSFALEWADLDSQASLGESVILNSLVLRPKLSPKLIMPGGNSYGLSQFAALNSPSEDYYRDLVDYCYDSQFLKPLGFCLRNLSGTTASDTLLTARVSKVDGLRLHDRTDRPIKPSRNDYILALSSLRSLKNIRTLADQMALRPEPKVADFPTHWEITIRFGDVLPKATVWSSHAVYLGADRSMALQIASQLFAKNLASPQSCDLKVEIRGAQRAMTRIDCADPPEE